MECSGKREIEGEVKKEWMESVKEWEWKERKEVEVMKKEENMDEMNIHTSDPDSFELNGRTINCSEQWQSCIIDRELKSVWLLFISR